MSSIKTDTQLKNYKIPSEVKEKANGTKTILLKDSTPNLYIEVMQGKTKTTKTFYYRYKDRTTKKQKSLLIGKYPSISLNEARQKATEYATARDRGENIKSQTEKALTFGNVATAFLDFQKSKLTPKCLQDKKGRIEKYLYPNLKDLKISEISRRELVETIEKRQDYEAQHELSTETSRKVFGILKNIMKFAVSKGFIEFSPLGEVDFKDIFRSVKSDKHYKAITDPKRLKEFLLTLKNDTNLNLLTLYGLKFALHTALRSKNIRRLKWDYIDFENNLITIPAPNMKTKKESNDFKLPLTTQTKAILKELQNYKRSEFVFYSDISKSKTMSVNTLNQAIKRLGFGDEMHFHGLRSTFSTIANANTKAHGINSEIIEKCLDHTPKDRIKAIYDRNEFLKERFELMQWYSNFLENLENE